jgi:murein DD-endopeptidase MepM/ murein hydrolase activator NlpD
MEKILASTDKLIAVIGDFIIEKPKLACTIFGLVITILIVSFSISSHSTNNATISLSIPAAQPAVTTVPASITHAVTIASQQTPAPAVTAVTTDKLASNVTWHTIKIKPGTNLAVIFKHLKLSQEDIVHIAALGTLSQHLKPGQHLRIAINAEHQVEQIIYPLTAHKNLTITRTHTGFITQTNQTGTITVAKPVPANAPALRISKTTKNASITEPAKTMQAAPVHIPNMITGTFHYSLYRDAHRAGLTNKQTAELVKLFAQDPTIEKAMHAGDTFAVLFQNSHKLGKKLYSGDIMAAKLMNHGKTYELVRFTDPDGNTQYYTPQGISLKPLLERAPVNYTHISSFFTERRWHPILHFARPHLGVDYAAPTGTPIKAAGDGRIVYQGWESGFGNTIIIKHNNEFTTLYAHMSRFANFRIGSYIKQNQVIGYVGSTGLATGPHLHFEIHVDNVARNPLIVTLPNGTPIDKAYRKDFFAHVRPLLAELNLDEKARRATRSTASKKS